ncbi:MAG TPA: class F sortase [Micromonosporaceae bacterium]|nr:class F sortase [Micromonosporaceae bacterium]
MLVPAAAGAALLVLAGVVAWRVVGPAPADFGGAAAAGLASPASSAAASPAGLAAPPSSPAATRAGSAPPPRVRIQDGALPSAVRVPPVRLSIPAVGASARVVPVGVVAGTDGMDVPRSVDTVGWYRYGSQLASTAGSIVLAGHVDGAAQGPGAFFRLREVPAGARVTVIGSDGAVRTYQVVAREVFDKSAVPLDRLFARDGRLRLTLVTCGGEYDAARRAYRDNVVVTAVPVD